MFHTDSYTVPPARHKRIAMLGTYSPRKCGIATFTGDLAQSVSQCGCGPSVDVIALSDQSGYSYPAEVVRELFQEDRAGYIRLAQFIDGQGYQAVSIQHEYGIFGGLAGSYVLDFASAVSTRIVTTFHTVLDQPTLPQKLVIEALGDRSESVVVMSHKAVELLENVYGLPSSKIKMIPHGVPEISTQFDERFRLGIPSENCMILTFGLLSPDKGIHNMISAMPKIIESCPGATYVIVGATHPHIVRHCGESYREELEALVNKLGLQDNVKFVNEFVPIDELTGYLSAMDIYVTPYLKPQQITSGTLAYALGSGKPVISTPYWHAQELLDEGRGILVPFHDSDALAQAVIQVQLNPKKRLELSRLAKEYSASMLWSEVGKQYSKSLHKELKYGGDQLDTQISRYLQ